MQNIQNSEVTYSYTGIQDFILFKYFDCICILHLISSSLSKISFIGRHDFAYRSFDIICKEIALASVSSLITHRSARYLIAPRPCFNSAELNTSLIHNCFE